MFRNSIHTFKNLAETGLDQVPVNGIIQVVDADNSATNKVGFVQLISKASITPTSTLEELLSGVVGEYKDIVQSDTAGKLYNPEKKYQKGDVVLLNPTGTSFETFVAKTDTTGAFDANAWKDFAEDLEFRGGKWTANKNYKPGDIVSHEAGQGNVMVFIALTNSSNANPVTSLAEWQSLENTEYQVATHTPSAGGTAGGSEYPDVSTVGTPASFIGRPGATWTIDGLTAVGYTMTSGPITGITVMNGDKFVWQGDHNTPADATDDLWSYKASPTVAGEVGGVLWNSTANYQTGAIVSFSGKLYISNKAIGNTSTNLDPTQDTTNWTLVDENTIISSGTLKGDYITWDTTSGKWVTSPAPTFLSLTDTPSSLDAGKKLVTNSSGTKVEYEDDNLDSLNDVDVTTPLIGDVITYQAGATGNKWVNATLATVAEQIRLQDLKDVSDTMSTGETISWDAAAGGGVGTWKFKKIPTELLDLDVNYTSLADDDLLIRNGSNWENISSVTLIEKLLKQNTTLLEMIADVDGSPVDGDSLIYNNISHKWETTPVIIPPETAGKAWFGGTIYRLGDIVSFDSKIYLAKVDVTSQTDPSIDELSWLAFEPLVQSDWTQTDVNSDSYIQNKPDTIDAGNLPAGSMPPPTGSGTPPGGQN